jgi:hypothetical protein
MERHPALDQGDLDTRQRLRRRDVRRLLSSRSARSQLASSSEQPCSSWMKYAPSAISWGSGGRSSANYRIEPVDDGAAFPRRAFRTPADSLGTDARYCSLWPGSGGGFKGSSSDCRSRPGCALTNSGLSHETARSGGLILHTPPGAGLRPGRVADAPDVGRLGVIRCGPA